MGVINGSKHKLIYDGMWHFDIPKCRDVDAGKVEVIARNSCGEAYASTTLTITPRQDDYRSVLRHNVKPFYDDEEARNIKNKSSSKVKEMYSQERTSAMRNQVAELHSQQQQTSYHTSSNTTT